MEDQVLLTLMYYREYRTQFHIAATYGISESAVCRTIKRIERVLMKIKELQLPGKQKLSGSRQEVSVVVIDATEMPIERPKKSNSSTIRAKRSDIPCEDFDLKISNSIGILVLANSPDIQSMNSAFYSALLMRTMRLINSKTITLLHSWLLKRLHCFFIKSKTW